MPSVPKTSFAGGEWAPILYSRSDLERYKTAVRTMRNMFIHPQGAVSNRGGTEFIVEVKDSAKQTRLIPFQFSVEQGYILEFGEQYMRVIKDGGQVIDDSGNGVSIVESTGIEWIASGSGTAEYYGQLVGGGDPSFTEPETVYEGIGILDRTMPKGVLGSLTSGDWGWGNNDALGFNTIYLRMSGDVNPDTTPAGYCEAAYVEAPGYGVDIVESSKYKWTLAWPFTASTYYMSFKTGGAPGIAEPGKVYEDVGGADTELTIGGNPFVLAAGEWIWYNRYPFGPPYETIYIHLTDGTDPDSKADGYCEACYTELPGEGTSIITDRQIKWTLSGSGTNEYYLEAFAGGDPNIAEPLNVFENVGGTDNTMVEGTLGALTQGKWAWGDNDTLGFDTIYVRLSDNTDPDSKTQGYLEAGYIEEIETPYLEADLPLLSFTQSADVLYVTHPSYPIKKISRTDHAAWTIEDIIFGSSIDTPANLIQSVAGGGASAEYKVTAVSATGEESLPSSALTALTGVRMTWDTVEDADSYNIYKDRDASEAFGWIGYAFTEVFDEPAAGITPDFSKSPPIAKDILNNVDEYPGACAFLEQRLIYARTNSAPQTLFGSRIGAFDNMNVSSPIQDDDAFVFTINSQQVNEILWVAALKGLIIGTAKSEWSMTAGGNSDAVTPSSVLLQPQSQWGVAPIQPVILGNTVLFIGSSKAIVRDLVYSYEVDGYAGNDVSLLASHLFKEYTLSEWAYQKHPDSIVWCVRSDGKLLGLTYYKEHEVWGWHQHDTDGYFESVAAIEISGSETELYVIVKRTINSVTKRYIERFKSRLPSNDLDDYDVQDSYFVDCGLTLDNPIDVVDVTKATPIKVTVTSTSGLSTGDLVDIVEVGGTTELNGNRYKIKNVLSIPNNSFELTDPEDDSDIDGSGMTAYTSGGKVREAVTAISGLDHLEGESVAILANGNVVEGKSVSSGALTLDDAASRVHVGLAYISEMETLDFLFATQEGSVQDKIRHVPSTVVSLENTRALWIGQDIDNLVEVAFRTTEPLGSPTNLFTGDKDVVLYAGDESHSRLFIRNTEPVPLTIISMIARVSYGNE